MMKHFRIAGPTCAEGNTSWASPSLGCYAEPASHRGLFDQTRILDIHKRLFALWARPSKV